MIKRLDVMERQIAKKMLKLQKEAYRVEAEYLGSDLLPPLQDTVQSIMLSHEIFYGYWLKRKLIGAIAYEKSRLSITLTRVMVSPRYFQQGIASKLIHHLLKLEGEENVYYVTTGAKNAPAIQLYKKFQFQEASYYETREGIMLIKFMRQARTDAFPKA